MMSSHLILLLLLPYTTLFRSPRARPPSSCRTPTHGSTPMRRGPLPSPRLPCPLGEAVQLPSSPFLAAPRSEEHTSELQSRFDLVCRLLLEKKIISKPHYHSTD